MARHWRCANAHDWTGDLGGLTHCPVCGCADVYEVRQSGAPDTPVARVKPARAAPPPPSLDESTWIQEVPAAFAPPTAPKPDVALRLEPPLPAPDPSAETRQLNLSAPPASVHEQITREMPAPPVPGDAAAAPSAPGIPGDNDSVTWIVPPSDPSPTDTWMAPPVDSKTSVVAPPAENGTPSGRLATADTESLAGDRPAPAVAPRPRGVPRVAGYEILGVLGRGGMGVVYKARQEGLNRLAALKMILGGPHADSAGQGRFRAEAEAIAALQHPNIVQVYEVGEYDGLPYFSLEYLDGGSLQQRLAGRPLPPREAASLTEQLARAIHYAHEHGIVHRDLKPGNILFKRTEDIGRRGTEDRGPRTEEASPSSVLGPLSSVLLPKITDFGLARRMGADSSLTGTGMVLGTPSYMAPEQAEGRTHEAGPPADIHALGAILYEMLTGRPPFLGADPTATVLQVRLMEPVPPRRGQPDLPRDLETITLKCLEKDPRRRYASAAALADDLRRFLDGQPILARPVSPLEKAWKWAKRNKVAAAAAVLGVAFGLALLVGGGAFARYEYQRAEMFDKLRQDADRERDDARKKFRLAREAVDKFLTQVGDEKLLEVPGMERVRRQLLEEALKFCNLLLESHSDDPAVLQEVGWAYQRVGYINNLLGQRREAVRAYREAVRLFGGLAAQDPDTPNHRRDLADTHRLLAVVLEAEEHTDEADRSFNIAHGLLNRLVAENRDSTEYPERLGELLNNRGVQLTLRKRAADAERAFRAALAVFDQLCAKFQEPRHAIERARVQSSLGALLLTQGQPGPALDQLRAAADGLAAVIRYSPSVQEYSKELGRAYDNLGAVLAQGGQPEAATKAFHEAVQRFDKLVQDHPRVPDYRFALALALDNLAHLLLKTSGGWRAAEPHRERARALWSELVNEFPANADYGFRYALSLDESGNFLEKADRRAEAIRAIEKALKLLIALVDADPFDPVLRRELARRHLNLGILLTRDHQEDEGEHHYSQAAFYQEELLRHSPGDDALRLDLITTYVNRAALMRHLARPRDEEWSWRRVAELQERRVKDFPRSADLAADLAGTRFTLADLRGNRPAEALRLLQDAYDGQRAARGLAPARADLAADLAKYGLALAEAQVSQGEHAAAAATVGRLAGDLPPSWDGWPRLAGLLGRCIRLARTDAALAADARAGAVKGYGEQALGLLRKAAAAGLKDAAALRTADDLEPLRAGEEFREAFQKIVAEIEGRVRGG